MGPMPVAVITAIETSGNSGRMRRALGTLEAANLQRKRQKLGRELADARRAREDALRASFRPMPGTVIPSPQTPAVPLTFKAEPKRRRVTRPATDTAPPVKVERTYTPILGKDVPKEIKETTKIHKDAGHLSREWFMVGFTGPDGSTTDYYARLHGNSVRYAVAA